MVIPKAMLRKHGLSIGDTLELSLEGTTLYLRVPSKSE